MTTQVSVETAGIAAGAYRLVSDKTKFHMNNMTSLAVSLPSGSSGNFESHGKYFCDKDELCAIHLFRK